MIRHSMPLSHHIFRIIMYFSKILNEIFINIPCNIQIEYRSQIIYRICIPWLTVYLKILYLKNAHYPQSEENITIVKPRTK